MVQQKVLFSVGVGRLYSIRTVSGHCCGGFLEYVSVVLIVFDICVRQFMLGASVCLFLFLYQLVLLLELRRHVFTFNM